MNSADAISRVEELLLHKGRLLKKYIRVIIISEHISDNVVAIASAIQAYSIPRGRNMFIRSIYLSEIHLVEVVWRCVLIWSHKPRWRPPMSLFTSALLMACKSTHHVFKRRGKQFTK